MPRGRPVTLTDELRDRICGLVRRGNFRQVAAMACRVPLRTFWRWCQRGKKARSGVYFDFWQALLEAEQAAEIKSVDLVMKASEEDARHAEWWLERKHPDRWGRKDTKKLEHSGGLRLELVEELADGPGDDHPEGQAPPGAAGVPKE